MENGLDHSYFSFVSKRALLITHVRRVRLNKELLSTDTPNAQLCENYLFYVVKQNYPMPVNIMLKFTDVSLS